MTKILVGVFLGVFIGALGYELVSRNNPETIEKIRKKVSEKVDDFMGLEETDEQEA
jgi:hypothetical protein